MFNYVGCCQAEPRCRHCLRVSRVVVATPMTARSPNFDNQNHRTVRTSHEPNSSSSSSYHHMSTDHHENLHNRCFRFELASCVSAHTKTQRELGSVACSSRTSPLWCGLQTLQLCSTSIATRTRARACLRVGRVAHTPHQERESRAVLVTPHRRPGLCLRHHDDATCSTEREEGHKVRTGACCRQARRKDAGTVGVCRQGGLHRRHCAARVQASN